MRFINQLGLAGAIAARPELLAAPTASGSAGALAREVQADRRARRARDQLGRPCV